MDLPNPTCPSLFCYVVVTTKKMTTKSMPHHRCNHFVGVIIFGSGFEKFDYGLRNYKNWDFLINSVLYQPVNFSDIFSVSLSFIEISKYPDLGTQNICHLLMITRIRTRFVDE